MSIDKYKEDIITLISKNGPMGVNAIQREIGVPLSTLQKYLHRQTYFKMNDDKKWDLPENVIGEIKNNSLGLMTNVVENSILLLRSQLDELVQHVDNALGPINTLKKGINNLSTPVAAMPNKSSDIDKRIASLLDNTRKLSDLIKKNKANIPEEYQDVLLNYDHIGLVMKEGSSYTSDFLEGDIYSMLSGNARELSEDTLQVLKENQRES